MGYWIGSKTVAVVSRAMLRKDGRRGRMVGVDGIANYTIVSGSKALPSVSATAAASALWLRCLSCIFSSLRHMSDRNTHVTKSEIQMHEPTIAPVLKLFFLTPTTAAMPEAMMLMAARLK